MHAAASWGEPTSEGNTGAFYGTVHAVIKRESHGTTRHVANELLANRLAAALGLPVPAGALVDDEMRSSVAASDRPTHRFAYACFRLGQFNSLPAGVLPAIAAAHPLMAAGITVFDHWIANGDRHARNIVATSKIPLMIYDHGCILGGESRASLLDQDPMMGVTGGLGPHLGTASHLMRWIDAVKSLPAPLFSSCLDQIRNAKLLTVVETNHMMSWLDTRRTHLEQLVRGALADLPDWPLL
jgi:hypothetical protein